MADSDPTLADLSPALQTVRQAIIAFVDRGAIPVHDIPSLCMHVARLDREGKPPGPDWMRQLAEFLPGAFVLAAEGMKGSVADVRAGLERRAFSAEQLLQAIGDGMMGRVNGGDVPTLVRAGHDAPLHRFAPSPWHWRSTGIVPEGPSNRWGARETGFAIAGPGSATAALPPFRALAYPLDGSAPDVVSITADEAAAMGLRVDAAGLVWRNATLPAPDTRGDKDAS